MRIDKIQGKANFSITAIQENNFLKVETISPRKNKMTENLYARRWRKKTLIVNFILEDKQTREIFTLRRVYDRILLNPFAGGADEIQ